MSHSPDVTDLYDPGAPQVLADPYPTYRRMREVAPVGWHNKLQAWVVTRYDDVLAVFKDRRFSSARVEALFQSFSAQERAQYATLEGVLRRWVFYSDPPSHTRMRSVLNASFTPARVKAIQPEVETIAAGLVEGAVGLDEFDAVAAIAGPLPVAVFARLFGVQPSEAAAMQCWSDGIATFITHLRHTAADADVAQRAVEEAMVYFEQVLTERRARPTDDVLSLLATQEFQGELLSLVEVVASATMLIFAGHGTLTSLLGNVVAALVAHPDVWGELRRRPELAPAVTEEALRYDMSVHILARVAAEDVELGGQTIRAGQRVLVLPAAANRDPAVFPDPDQFRLGRPNASKHLGMGHGIHYCVGAPLGRLEVVAVITELAKRLPTLRYAGTGLVRHSQTAVRGAKSLTLTTQA